uniref:Uncharacterized protein n=1 Tax=Parascaris univalens TaxID=6257 RepID=A0A915AXU2_PARUN
MFYSRLSISDSSTSTQPDSSISIATNFLDYTNNSNNRTSHSELSPLHPFESRG